MTAKELEKTLSQEKFDVKGFPVVVVAADGTKTEVQGVRLDTETKQVVLSLVEECY